MKVVEEPNGPAAGQQVVPYYVHAVGRDPAVVEAAESDAVEQILTAAGFIPEPRHHVFLGECADALEEPRDVEDGEDRHEPVKDLRRSPNDHGHRGGGHIHCHTCRRVRVTVSYNGVEKHHNFSPATTIDTARLWAVSKFGINAVDAETLILKISGVVKPPQPDAHLGDLVRADGHCAVALELVPDEGRVNG
jgi:hypothetical protein